MQRKRSHFRRSSALFALLGATLILFGGMTGLHKAAAGKCPNVQIVIDRSTNMGTTLDFGSRLGDTVLDLSLDLSTYDAKFRLGLTGFPKTAAACDEDTAVLPNYSNAATINSDLAAYTAIGSPSTGTAISSVASLPDYNDATRPQYIVLITEGAPNCGGDPNTAAGTVTAITQAYMQTPSIATFVLGVGAPAGSDATALNQMAVAGGRPLTGGTTSYYTGTDILDIENSLVAILDAISTEVGSCSDGGPSDMGGGPPDMSAPADMSKPHDMAEKDLGGGRDMSAGNHDLAGPPVDLGGPGTGDGGGVRTGNLPPEVDWIQPNQFTFGSGGSANIVGRNFAYTVPQAQVFFNGGGNVMTIDNALVNNAYNIQVSVPSSLPVGVYDVVVKNPDGQIGTQPGALTIVDQPSGCACSIGSHGAETSTAARLAAGALALFLVLGLYRRRAARARS
jgi:hypothetical protein